MNISVSWFPIKPYFTETTEETDEAPRYAGRGYTILTELAKALNFSIYFPPYQGWDNVSLMNNITLAIH